MTDSTLHMFAQALRPLINSQTPFLAYLAETWAGTRSRGIIRTGGLDSLNQQPLLHDTFYRYPLPNSEFKRVVEKSLEPLKSSRLNALRRKLAALGKAARECVTVEYDGTTLSLTGDPDLQNSLRARLPGAPQ